MTELNNINSGGKYWSKDIKADTFKGKKTENGLFSGVVQGTTADKNEQISVRFDGRGSASVVLATKTDGEIFEISDAGLKSKTMPEKWQ